jgi:hypothetical protein
VPAGTTAHTAELNPYRLRAPLHGSVYTTGQGRPDVSRHVIVIDTHFKPYLSLVIRNPMSADSRHLAGPTILVAPKLIH